MQSMPRLLWPNFVEPFLFLACIRFGLLLLLLVCLKAQRAVHSDMLFSLYADGKKWLFELLLAF